MDRTAESQRPSAELNTLLSAFLKLACRTLAAEVGYVSLVDSDTGDVIVKATFGTTYKNLAAGARVPKGTGIGGLAVARKQSVLVADVASEPRCTLNAIKDLDFVPRDLVCVPLTAEDYVIGVISLLNKTNGSFTEDDAKLMESVGSLAASAIRNAELYEAEQKNRRLAQTLSAFSLAITQSLDVDVVLRILLDYLGQLVPYDKAMAMLMEQNYRLVIRAVRASERNGGPGICGCLRRELHPGSSRTAGRARREGGPGHPRGPSVGGMSRRGWRPELDRVSLRGQRPGHRHVLLGKKRAGMLQAGTPGPCGRPGISGLGSHPERLALREGGRGARPSPGPVEAARENPGERAASRIQGAARRSGPMPDLPEAGPAPPGVESG